MSIKKYAIVVDEKTKACNVGTGDDVEFYKSLGMTLQKVEEAENGNWYLEGYAPASQPKIANYDTYKLMNVLYQEKFVKDGVETNLWAILKNYLLTEKDGFYKDCWDSCKQLKNNDPNFYEPLEVLKSQYPDINVESILEQCKI